VTFDGRFHKVTGAGIAPLPVQRPIPIWIGAASPPGYRRAGQLADGWFPMMGPGPRLDDARAVVEQAAVQAGRDPGAIGMEGRVAWRGDTGAVIEALAEWEKAGATHVTVNTMGAGLRTVDEHLAALAEVAAELPLA
jgi:alkanesulfonate monooxygenase SsuD/methylene tetrahydromethanopterin reductase-like flavin-dependent oxidoreductase (luciferase family)